MYTFKFGDTEYNCQLEVNDYPNGGKCLDLIDVESGEYVACASVCVPEIFLQPDQILIKNYLENEGVLQQLIDQKVVEFIKSINIGWVNVEVCKLLIHKS